MASEKVTKPRSFRLLEELESAEKADGGNNGISYGLDDQSDTAMMHWNATIIGPDGSNYAGGFYQLEITVPGNYPERPPHFQFISNDMTSQLPRFKFIDPKTGKIIPENMSVLANWNSDYNIGVVLNEIRNAMG
jgi:ubiquitin-protein ligase